MHVLLLLVGLLVGIFIGWHLCAARHAATRYAIAARQYQEYRRMVERENGGR